MAVPKKREAKDGRTCTLNALTLRGMNTSGFGEKLPAGIGDLLKKWQGYVPVAMNLTATGVRELYTGVETTLQPFKPWAILERCYRTDVGEVVDDQACNTAEAQGAKLHCGSYLKFANFEKTLEGTLYVGWKEDRQWVEEHGASLGNAEAVTKFVGQKVKEQGVQALTDAGIGYLAWRFMIPLGLPVAIADLVRRGNNVARFDAHWELELTPKKGMKFTGEEANAYLKLAHQYGKK